MADPHENCPVGLQYFLGYDENGEMKTECRSMVCSRCNKCTGNNHQGHYWALCKVTGDMRINHFCCPGDCELENKE